MLSRKAAQIKGALAVYLLPKLARDAHINLPSLVAGITSRNYPAKYLGLTDAVATVMRGKLALDASIDDLPALLEGLKELDEEDDDGDDEELDEDDLQAWLAKLSPSAIEMLRQALAQMDVAGIDEPPPFPGRPRPGGTKDPIQPSAMDAASAGFAQRYPDAMRIGMDGFGSAAPNRKLRPTTRQLDESRDGFLSRFPDARKIGAA